MSESSEKAWEKWQDSLYALDPKKPKDAFLAGFASGHAAGGVEALTEAAEAVNRAKPKHITRDYTPVDQAWDEAANVVRARATELGGVHADRT